MAPRGKAVKKAAKGAKAVKTTRRPLNAFIAYRKYYSSIFMLLPGAQQKLASSLLTYMWQFEQGKPAWTVMAKAWSIIRDFQGKENSPLDLFIGLNAPLLNIIPPDEYLITMGFGIVYVDGQPALKHVLNPIHRGAEIHDGSVGDILRTAVDAGYVGADVLHRLDQNILTVKPSVDARRVTEAELPTFNPDEDAWMQDSISFQAVAQDEYIEAPPAQAQMYNHQGQFDINFNPGQYPRPTSPLKADFSLDFSFQNAGTLFDNDKTSNIPAHHEWDAYLNSPYTITPQDWETTNVNFF